MSGRSGFARPLDVGSTPHAEARMLEGFLQDVRYAVRALGRSPLFTFTAVVSLAVGIGSTTAIFTLVNALLLRPPAGIGAPERLVDVGRSQNGRGFDNFSYPTYVAYRDGARTLSGLAALQLEPRSISVQRPGGAGLARGAIVSGNFFEVLQARPAAGRFFLPDEDRVPRAHPVVVLGHGYWREQFGSDPAVVGGAIVLNGTPFTVVGVAEEGFQGPSVLAPDLWAPMTSVPLLGGSDGLLQRRENVWLMAIGRLAPGVSVAAAQADLGGIARQLQLAFPASNREQGARVMKASIFPGEIRTVVRGFMSLLFAVTGLVLLIASVNVAGMLLARAASRRREIAVRLAIGAPRGRLLGQLLTESVLLFLAAGVAGVLVAHWMVAGLMSLVPRLPLPLAVHPTLDLKVLGFALVVSLVAGLLAGLTPALQSTRPALASTLRGDAAGAGAGRATTRAVLLVAQMALSMLMLVTAGLFLRALTHAREIDPGFDPVGVEITSLDLALAGYDDATGPGFARTLLERARAIPGVESAAFSAALPLDGGGMGLGGISVPDRTPPDQRRGWNADWNVVTPGYFDVMRMGLVSGRGFVDTDREGAADVAIINQTLAGWLFPGDDAVGRSFRNDDRTVTIVGVARDARYRTLGEEPRGFVYVPLAQRYMSRTTLMVRTAPGVTVAATVRKLVADLDPALPLLDQTTLADYTAASLFPQRVALWVAGSLGGIALLLAVLGIYGVTAYGVTQRTREIGIRIALGSPRGRVLRLVLRQGVLLAAAGILVGFAASVAVTGLLRGMLYGVPPTDTIALVGAAALLLLAALAASWLPARRAAGVDPMQALRSE
ncbi:MAG: ABC transporter permease [Gemmatimonadaceae bacterium]